MGYQYRRHPQCPLLIIKQESSQSFRQLRLNTINIQSNEKEKKMYGHTFPTPVGPRNKNEATGRFGACKPALDILTASLIADKT